MWPWNREAVHPILNAKRSNKERSKDDFHGEKIEPQRLIYHGQDKRQHRWIGFWTKIRVQRVMNVEGFRIIFSFSNILSMQHVKSEVITPRMSGSDCREIEDTNDGDDSKRSKGDITP